MEKYICYETNPPLKLTIAQWREFYNKYITEWDSFYDWWLDMIYRSYLIYEYKSRRLNE